MTKFEFTDRLRKALSGRVNHSVVNDHVAYYEKYIDAEIKKGRSEQEVLQELGDPRLIAKTIIEAEKAGGDAPDLPEEDGSQYGFNGRSFRMPFWVFVIILLLATVLLFKVIGIMLALLLPIAVPIVLVYMLIRYFRRR